MHIRDAHAGDIDAITAIYNDAVSNTLAIWNERTVDAANRTDRLADRQRAGLSGAGRHRCGRNGRWLRLVRRLAPLRGFSPYGRAFRVRARRSPRRRRRQGFDGGIDRARARPGQACDGGGHRSGQCRLDRPAQAAWLRGSWLDAASRHQVAAPGWTWRSCSCSSTRAAIRTALRRPYKVRQASRIDLRWRAAQRHMLPHGHQNQHAAGDAGQGQR